MVCVIISWSRRQRCMYSGSYVYFNYSRVNIALHHFLHNHVNYSKLFYIAYFIRSSGFVSHLIVPDSLKKFVFQKMYDSVGGHLGEKSYDNNTIILPYMIIIQENRSILNINIWVSNWCSIREDSY